MCIDIEPNMDPPVEQVDNNTQLIVLIINSIMALLTLMINAHQSYKSRHFESDCCGNRVSWGSEHQ
jgi:hypothetical protein